MGVVLKYVEERKAHAVLVVADLRRSWFPRL